MPVHSFSVPEKKVTDVETIQAIKEHCDKKCINFSGLVVDLLKQWWEANDRRQS